MGEVQSPSAASSPRRLRRLARRAARSRRRSADAFLQLAERAGVSPRQLRLLADAWSIGGRHGVAGLGPAPAQAPEHGDAALAAAQSEIDEWRRRHFPLEALDFDAWRNRLTVWRLVPGDDARHDRVKRRALMQLRLDSRMRWHLYRKAAQGEWWPVAISARASLSDCLEIVRLDVAQEFWGTTPRAYESAESRLKQTRERE